MKRYGKPSADWFKAKRWFFDQDEELAAECQRIAGLYASQPLRSECKICETPIEGEPAFTKYGVPYFICSSCGHLNGAFEDTEEFCAGLYMEEASDLFSRMYDSKNIAAFQDRRDTIYRPKADFLLDALREEGEDPAQLDFVDFGAGSGYLISALRDAGVRSATGFEVSEAQVRLANAMIGGEDAVRRPGLEDAEQVLSTVEADVVTLVFTLEHAQDPKGILRAVRANPRVRYVFIAVPMYSPAVFIEFAFDRYAQRHLADGHTHLFSVDSLDRLCAEFDLRRTSEWWFGSDMIDFYRMIWMEMQRRGMAGFEEEWKKMMIPVLDQLQEVIDQKHLSSDIHFLASIDR